MLQKLNLILFAFISLSCSLYAQTGKIAGKIVDGKTGETLPGATVMVEGTTRGALSDLDGNFTLSGLQPGKYTIISSYITYDNKKFVGVVVKANDVTTLNIGLDQASSQNLVEVVVEAQMNKENTNTLILMQKNNTSLSDGISGESIRRTPDRNTSDVLKRVSGVTIQDDKFVIVRGLNERYNASYLNNAPLPSTEPDKKAFSFDLFPSNMLDNIVVNKTATPDMPSEFAGGIVQINTKSIPEKNFLSLSVGGGYNSITTGRDKTIYEGGKLDKLGFDDGSRNLPAQIPALEDKASWISNSEQARMATYMKNDWGYSQSKFAPNTSAQLAAGYNFKLKDRDFLGVIFSLAYNNTQNLYTLERTEYDGLSIDGKDNASVEKEQRYVQKVNQTQVTSASLLNITAKLNSNNSISIKNLFSGSSDNRFINSLGSNDLKATELIESRVNSRYFSANRILSSQLSGDHFIPQTKIKISWNGAYSNIQRTVPDLRFTSYSRYKDFLPYDPSTGPNLKDTMYKADISTSTGPNYSGYRVYSSLNENIKSGKLDLSRLFKVSENIKIDAKIGGFYQDRDRQFNIRQFGMQQYSNQAAGIFRDDSLLYLPEDQIFSAQNMSVTPVGTGGFKLFENTKNDDNYHAHSTLLAGYGMAEIKFSDKVRVIGGLRYESYSQKLNVKYPLRDSVFVDNTVVDLLPSLNVVYNITEKLGIRLAYYKTLNRPEFRELAVTNWYDPETRFSIAGNSTLTRCYINNYDARFEIYPGRGQLLTATGFYKHFTNPIERYMFNGSENQIYYRNANYADLYGGELEFRLNVGAVLRKDSVKFLNNLNVFSNLSLMKSQVNVKDITPGVPETRDMQGQSPYIINGGISYIDNEHGFSITGMVNRVGPRIYLVGNNLFPNRYENARTVVDLQLTKTFYKNRIELRFNIKDLLHQDWIVYYKGDNRAGGGYKKDIDYVNFRRNFGSTYSFILSYRF